MKTTLDLSDALFLQAKELAKRDGLTLRALVEEGLRKVLGERAHVQPKPFVLKDMSFDGGTPLAMEWSQLRELANERPSISGTPW